MNDLATSRQRTHRPDGLSGGQKRGAIARAMVNHPTILLVDEPTANLDLQTGRQIIELLRELCEKHGVTVISATHDHEMVAVSNRVVCMADGKIERIAFV